MFLFEGRQVGHNLQLVSEIPWSVREVVFFGKSSDCFLSANSLFLRCMDY